MPRVAPEQIAVVMLNWNGHELTRACLRSLAEQTARPHSVVVVDNGSTDGSPEALAREFPDVVQIRNGENRGFGPASNQGALQAAAHGAEWTLWLNNDTEAAPDFLEMLALGASAGGEVGAVCPKVMGWEPRDLIWSAGGDYSLLTSAVWQYGLGQPDGSAFSEPRYVNFGCGCALMVSRTALERVGLFDEMFFPAYQEDVDLCHRLRQAGCLIRYEPRAVVWHKVSGSTGGQWNDSALRFSYRNMVLLQRKHLSRGLLPLGLAFQFAKGLYRTAHLARYGRFVLPCIVGGMWEGLRAPLEPREPRLPRPTGEAAPAAAAETLDRGASD
jgi:GT2 family glycosyltransferase